MPYILCLLLSTQALAKNGELSPELKRKASILGWCIEWVTPYCFLH